MKQTVYILSGLPGSGKSYFAERLKEDYKKNDRQLFVYHQDSKDSQWWKYHGYDDLVMDCLNLTNDQIICCINDVLKHIRLPHYWNFIIVRWKPDIEKCLNNDSDRREISSSDTIKHAKFEYPDLVKIRKETCVENIEIEEKEIVEKNIGTISIDEKYNIRGGYLCSTEWCLGGTSRSYDSNWNNVYSSIDAEEPIEFETLDNYLTERCPNLSFIQYKRIRKECVDIIAYDASDYYSSGTYAYWRCDMEKLEKILKDIRKD